MTALDELTTAPAVLHKRTLTPRRLSDAPLDGEPELVVTTARPFRLHYCGPIGSDSFTREIPAGTRFEVLEHHPAGLLRIRSLDPELDVQRALVDVEHFDLTGLDLDPVTVARPARPTHFTTDDEEPLPCLDSTTTSAAGSPGDTAPRCASSTPARSSPNAGSCSGPSFSARLSSTPPSTPRPRTTRADQIADAFLNGEPVEIRHLPDVRRRLEARGADTGALELDLDMKAGTGRLVRKAP